MPDIATATRARIDDSAALVALVANRIYPVNRPQDSLLPAIRYVVISDNGGEHLKGSDGVFTARIQFDVFSKRYIETRETARLLVASLSGPGTTDGIKFGRILWDRPTDGGGDSAQGYIHSARVDLLVEYAVVV